MTVKQALRECPIFSALTDSELERIASIAVEKEYEAGATLFREGSSADEFLVITEGKIALQMSLLKEQGLSGKRTTVDIISKNDITGWSAIVEPHIYTLTAVCLQKVKALSIDANQLRWLLRDAHEISNKIFKEVVKVVASRLDDTRQLLISERTALPKPE